MNEEIYFDDDKTGWHTPLIESIIQGEIKRAKLLIEQGADVNAPCSSGFTALHHAVELETNALEVTRLLIAKEANVNAQNKWGYAPIHLVLEGECAEELIKAGANVHCRDYMGMTPLHHVADVNVAKALIENGADINAVDNDGEVPLYRVIEQWHDDVAVHLVKTGASIFHAFDVEGSPSIEGLLLAAIAEREQAA